MPCNPLACKAFIFLLTFFIAIFLRLFFYELLFSNNSLTFAPFNRYTHMQQIIRISIIIPALPCNR